eukprot:1450378-Rhodomonas_salina.3
MSGTDGNCTACCTARFPVLKSGMLLRAAWSSYGTRELRGRPLGTKQPYLPTDLLCDARYRYTACYADAMRCPVLA